MNLASSGSNSVPSDQSINWRTRYKRTIIYIQHSDRTNSITDREAFQQIKEISAKCTYLEIRPLRIFLGNGAR